MIVLHLAAALCFVLVPPADETKPAAPPASGAALPITLEQCIYMAEKNSLTQRLTEIDVQIAKARVGQELGTFDTVLFLNHNYDRDINPSASSLEGGFGSVTVVGIESESTTLNGGFRGTLLNGATYQADINWSKRLQSPAPFSLFNPTYRADVGVAVTQPLLRGFGTTVNKAALLQARNTMRSNAEALEEQRLQQARAVIVAYWNYYFARRTLESRRFNVAQAERLLSINTRRKEVGDMKRLDVVEAESELAQRKLDLLIAQNDIGKTADALKRQIFPFDRLEEWAAELVPLTEPNQEARTIAAWHDLARTAIERRPELMRRRELLKNNDLQIVVAENAVLPQFDLTGSLRFNQLAASKGQVLNFDEDFYSVGGGFSLEMPIGNRTARYGLALARLQKIRALVEYQDAENDVVQQVRDAAREVQSKEQQIVAAGEAVRLAKERWDAEETRKKVGFSTQFQVFDAQEEWRAAVDSEIQAQRDYQIALAILGATQGTLLEEYGMLPMPEPKLQDRSGVHYDQ